MPHHLSLECRGKSVHLRMTQCYLKEKHEYFVKQYALFTAKLSLLLPWERRQHWDGGAFYAITRFRKQNWLINKKRDVWWFLNQKAVAALGWTCLGRAGKRKKKKQGREIIIMKRQKLDWFVSFVQPCGERSSIPHAQGSPRCNWNLFWNEYQLVLIPETDFFTITL